MLEYDRTDISEGIDVRQDTYIKILSCLSLLVILDKGFKCEPYLCNGCHDLM